MSLASQIVIKGVSGGGSTSREAGNAIILVLEPQDSNGALSYEGLVPSFIVTAKNTGSASISAAVVAEGSVAQLFVTNDVAETITVSLNQASCGTQVSTSDPLTDVDCNSTSIQLTFFPGTLFLVLASHLFTVFASIFCLNCIHMVCGMFTIFMVCYVLCLCTACVNLLPNNESSSLLLH